jgi:hypothetical protein
MLDYLLGLSTPKPGDGKFPRLVITFDQDKFITPKQVAKVSQTLRAQTATIAGPHIPWWGAGYEPLLNLVLQYLHNLQGKT